MDMDYFWGKYKIPVIVGGIILILAIGLGVYFGFFYEPPAPPEPEPDIVTDISVELMGEAKYKEKAIELLTSPYCTVEVNIFKGTTDKKDVVPYVSIVTAQTGSQAKIDMNIPRSPFKNFSNLVDVKAKKAYLYYSFPKETEAFFEEFNKEYIELSCNAFFTGVKENPDIYYEGGMLTLSEYTALAALKGVVLETDLSNKNYISNQEMISKNSNALNVFSDSDIDIEESINSLTFNAMAKTLSGTITSNFNEEYEALVNFSQGKITSIKVSYVYPLLTGEDVFYIEETIYPLSKDASLSSDIFTNSDKTHISLTEKDFASAFARSYGDNVLSLMWLNSEDPDDFFIDMEDLYFDISNFTIVDAEGEETSGSPEGSEETGSEEEPKEEDGLVDIMLDIYNALGADEKKELINFAADTISSDDMKSLISSFFGDN